MMTFVDESPAALECAADVLDTYRDRAPSSHRAALARIADAMRNAAREGDPSDGEAINRALAP